MSVLLSSVSIISFFIFSSYIGCFLSNIIKNSIFEINSYRLLSFINVPRMLDNVSGMVLSFLLMLYNF